VAIVRRVRAVPIALLAVAVAVGVFWDGGFDSGPQWAFAAAAGVAVLVACLANLARAPALLRSAPVIVLLAIAALQALSAAWTIESPSAALRAGAVTAAYAALAVGAGVALQPASRIATGIAVAAGITGLMGLVSAALLSTDFAERIEGGWRPEGPFGYPPALALVQVFALPVLLTAMTRARPAVAGPAAAGAAIAAGVLVLVANRVSLGMAILALGVALVAPERTVVARRLAVAWAIGLMAAAGVACHELFGGWTPRYAQAGPGSALVLLGVIAGLGLAWLVVRRQLGSARSSRQLPARRALVAGAGILAVAVAAGLLSGGALSARRFESHESFTHGRSWMWSAAYRTALDRPAQGYGAGSFFAATVARQPGHGRLTRFAHDFPLEQAVETGVFGFLLALALYAAAGRALWRVRGSPAVWLLGPAAAAFLLSNLVDWSWHLAGVGALFAVALGGALRPVPAR
jgi:hypothetical protein